MPAGAQGGHFRGRDLALQDAWAWRPSLSVEVLVLVGAAAFAVLYNNALWRLLIGAAGGLNASTAPLLGSLVVVLTLALFAGLALVLGRHTVKPVLAVLFLCTALASFFMDRYSVFIDIDMLRNVVRTDPAEAHELVTWTLVRHLLIYAALPVVLLSRVRVIARPLGKSLAIRFGAVAGALLLGGIVLMVQYRDAASLLRSHREARHLVTPVNYLSGLIRLARREAQNAQAIVIPVGLDAHRVVPVATSRRRQILVLAIGETVRAANFGLSGYSRQTTPELAKLDLAVFPRVQACGTSTEVSLPCMFSRVGRRDYDEARIRSEESLLPVLKRAGFEVEWIDNQSGCKGVCRGVAEQRVAPDSDPALCNGERCLDGVLLPRLMQTIDAHAGDLVVVLHMLGNHGPAYSQRYPPGFKRFTPACDSRELDDCSREEIVNAYDNAVLYTDHVLARTIEALAERKDLAAGLIFVSDHGESLGEAGLYLHGLPYRIAPAVQREVPMLLWMSPALERDAGLTTQCVRARTEGVTHDHLFHSVLGLLDIRTRAKDPTLDLFDGCRRGASTAPAAMVSAS